MFDFSPYLSKALDAEALAWIETAKAQLDEKGQGHLAVLFAQLARRTGKQPLLETGPGQFVDHDAAQVDLGMWRTCDAVGYVLVQHAGADDDTLVDLYLHGDFEERIAALRALALLPVTRATVELFGEVQRTNTVAHFEAGALDHNLAVRAMAEGGEDAGFTRDDFHRLILKAAFLDLPLGRMQGAFDEVDAPLAVMLQDFATEREAAGRPVWVDTWRVLGRAPCEGAQARILGGLEHGSDPVRLAAAEALRDLNAPELSTYAASRLPREPVQAVKDILASIV